MVVNGIHLSDLNKKTTKDKSSQKFIPRITNSSPKQSKKQTIRSSDNFFLSPSQVDGSSKNVEDSKNAGASSPGSRQHNFLEKSKRSS